MLKISLTAQLVKSLQSGRLGFDPCWEDPLEKEKATPLRYSGLENSRDCIVRRVAESDTTELLSLFYYIYTFIVVFSLSGVRLFATTWAVD